MHDLKQIIEACAETTRDKGFDTTQHATQIVLIATEVVEALECVTPSLDDVTDSFIYQISKFTEDFKCYQKAIRKPDRPYQDASKVLDPEHLYEELSDVVIRVFSYAGGNGRADQLIAALLVKIEKNRHRPEKHGKGF